jgi:hypothetical protein
MVGPIRSETEVEQFEVVLVGARDRLPRKGQAHDEEKG